MVPRARCEQPVLRPGRERGACLSWGPAGSMGRALSPTRILRGMDPRHLGIRPILAYYLGGTPLFFVLDAAWDLSVRASFLDELPVRLAYYGFLLACGGLAWKFPRRASWIGLGESAVTLVLLVVGFMTPILTMGAEVAADPFAPIGAPVTPEGIVNFAIAGGVAWWSFERRTGLS